MYQDIEGMHETNEVEKENEEGQRETVPETIPPVPEMTQDAMQEDSKEEVENQSHKEKAEATVHEKGKSQTSPPPVHLSEAHSESLPEASTPHISQINEHTYLSGMHTVPPEIDSLSEAMPSLDLNNVEA